MHSTIYICITKKTQWSQPTGTDWFWTLYIYQVTMIIFEQIIIRTRNHCKFNINNIYNFFFKRDQCNICKRLLKKLLNLIYTFNTIINEMIPNLQGLKQADEKTHQGKCHNSAGVQSSDGDSCGSLNILSPRSTETLHCYFCFNDNT